ncbi:carboxylesterase 1E [Teleopsis dalmanni]|uniref:carboxylesterase 1E n=1 Tax=Teleopsis dalmanni TaxID=139649 RepID=UPI0018CF5C4B|nr:carboxylesterase 1E [Teleopsis dalmanni]
MRVFNFQTLKIFLILLVSVTIVTSEPRPHNRVKRIVGGKMSKAPPPDDPVVFTRTYNRDARIEGFRNLRTGIYSFLGIHYAEPPVGENRYARPLYKRLAGDVNATHHGPPCIQPDPYARNRIVGDENCLLLNIYTPQMPDETTGLPVYVWIHPGGFRYGSAAQYDATPMAQEGVIVVTPQYRLGSLGIMGDGTKEFDGNLAIFDMASAIRWVNDYISHFGGDPKQIKAIGHGSGAASAMYLSMSRTARNAGDMSGVVAMSGTALSQYAIDKEPVQSVEEVAQINGCPTENEIAIINCLRQKPAQEIIENDSQVQTERLAGRALIKGLSASVGFQPHIEDGDDRRGLPALIVGAPEEQLRSGNFTPLPLLTGVTKHETANAFTLDVVNKVFGSAEKLLSTLPDVLKDLTSFLRIDAITGNILKPQLPGLASTLTPTLNEVLKVPETLNLDQIFSKVVQASTDVLFNLPAVLTSQVWSQMAPAFMYSFEYNGTKSKGINFLRGLPIVGNTQSSDGEIVAHGDELGYMFDANDIFGNPLPDTRLTSAEDLKVRKNMIGLLVKFAKNFKADSKIANIKDTLFQSITAKGTPFIKVDTGVEVGNDFRFCELSVFGASLTPLTTTSCKGLNALLSPVTGALGGVGGSLGGVGNTLGGVTGALTGSNTNRGSASGNVLRPPNSSGNRNTGLLGGSNGLLGGSPGLLG